MLGLLNLALDFTQIQTFALRRMSRGQTDDICDLEITSCLSLRIQHNKLCFCFVNIEFLHNCPFHTPGLFIITSAI